MTVTDIADEIYRELGEPSDLSIPPIAFWVRTNIGALNTLINETFSISEPSLEIINSDGVISIDAAAVLKRLYDVNYYQKKYLANLTTMSSDLLIEVTDGNRTVRRINRNEVGKTILEAKSQTQKNLSDLVTAYKLSKAAPRQIAGDDTTQGVYHGGYSSRTTDFSNA